MAETDRLRIRSCDGRECTLRSDLLEHFTDLRDDYEALSRRQSGSTLGDVIDVNVREPILRKILQWYENREALPTVDVLIADVLPYDHEVLFPGDDYSSFWEFQNAAQEMGAFILTEVLLEIAVAKMAGKTEQEGLELLGPANMRHINRHMEYRKQCLSMMERSERAARRAERAEQMAQGSSTQGDRSSKKASPKSPKKGRSKRRL